jgi:hypothetical protein
LAGGFSWLFGNQKYANTRWYKDAFEPRAIGPSFQRINAFKKRLEDFANEIANLTVNFLYNKGLPWRRLALAVWVIFLIGIAFAILWNLESLAIILTRIWTYLVHLLLEEVNGLTLLGNKLGLVGKDFATYVSAQVLADIIGAVVVFVLAAIAGFLLFGKFRQGLEFPTHKIRLNGRYSLEPEVDGVRTFSVKVSNEQGNDPAFNCRARITFKGLTWRDVVDIPNVRTQYSAHSREFNKTNYFKTVDLSFRLPWPDRRFVNTIFSGDYQPLSVLRLVPERDGIPEHFAVPCFTDTLNTQIGIGICLKPLYQCGEIRIIPEKGRYRSNSFSVVLDQEGWTLLV